jgi:hypothetical protein
MLVIRWVCETELPLQTSLRSSDPSLSSEAPLRRSLRLPRHRIRLALVDDAEEHESTVTAKRVGTGEVSYVSWIVGVLSEDENMSAHRLPDPPQRAAPNVTPQHPGNYVRH